MAKRNSNYVVVPLCDRHHSNSSPDGIHGQRRAWKLASNQHGHDAAMCAWGESHGVVWSDHNNKTDQEKRIHQWFAGWCFAMRQMKEVADGSQAS